MVRWLREEEVARWYWDSNNLTEEQLTEKWVKRTTEPDGKTDRYIISVDAHEIGEIQVADMSSFPETEAKIGIPGSAGVDVLIGESEWRNRGIGAAVISQFVKDYVFTRPGIKTCIIDPEPENLRAVRAYEKVGFRHVRTFHSDEDDVDVYLMRLDAPPLTFT